MFSKIADKCAIYTANIRLMPCINLNRRRERDTAVVICQNASTNGADIVRKVSVDMAALVDV